MLSKERVDNLLLTLAYLGHADYTHLQRLHFPDYAEKSVKNTLTEIKDAGHIEAVAWSIQGKPQPSMWRLTAKGHRQISALPAYPGKLPIRSNKLFAHDRRMVGTVVRCIEMARSSDLSGVQVYREVRLDLRKPRPKVDALLFLETGGEPAAPGVVPWCNGFAQREEKRWRIAIESDTGTQHLEILAEKAKAYRALDETPAWRQAWIKQHEALPIVYVSTTTPERAAQIAQVWAEAWPAGHFAVASEDGLTRNHWHYRAGGASTTRAVWFPNHKQLAAVKASNEAHKAKAAAERQAEIERQRQAKAEAEADAAARAAELAELEARAPRPAAELLRLLPPAVGYTIEFNELGRAIKSKDGRSAYEVQGIAFNSAERAAWQAGIDAMHESLIQAAQVAKARADRQALVQRRWGIAAKTMGALAWLGVLVVLFAGGLRVARAAGLIAGDVVDPLAAAAVPALSNGGLRCVEATRQLELREAPMGAVVAQIDAGDQVWIASRRPLAQLDPRARVQVWRIIDGRIEWTAWMQAQVQACGR